MRGLAIFAISRRGVQLASRIQAYLGGDVFLPQRLSLGVRPRSRTDGQVLAYGAGGVKSAAAEAFARYRGMVLILPVGAAVRLVAPVLANKQSDPGVVVVDEVGAHAIALLAGHAGGANELARQVAAAVGARPVITTAAEVVGSLALDLLGQEWGWSLEDSAELTRASAALLDGQPVGVYQDAGEEDWWRHAPANLVRYPTLEALMEASVAARLAISDRAWESGVGGWGSNRWPLVPDPQPPAPIVYRPKSLVVGVGCVRGTTAEELDQLIQATLDRHGLALASVRELATIDLKGDEPGLTELAARHGWPVRYFSAEELARAGAPSGASAAVEEAVGAPGVCEPAALLAAAAATLVVPKTQTRRATVAVARVGAGGSRGRLTVVGLGPGGEEDLTERARRALEDAEVVVGYHGYLDRVRPWLGPRQYHGSGIGEEVRRCRLAIDLARAGRRVALVSSGDAGIYGTAGLVFELLEQAGAAAEAARVAVVPGVSAANAAAALLGAPLMSDFAAISLSDLLTPWSTIEGRLEAAAAGDLVVVLYNPVSSRRRTQLARAQAVFLRHRPPQTPVGIVRNASGPGEEVTVTDLAHLLDHPIDMFTTVLVGNSATIRIGDRMVTRRGYGATQGAMP